MAPRTDGNLVRRALDGRGDAYSVLVERWTHRILGLCHAVVRQRETAEELTQETFVRAWVALGTLRDPDKFAPWLRGIARRICLDWLQAKRRPMLNFSQLGEDWTPDRDRSGSQGASQDSPADPLERAEENCRLLEELDKLPEELRTALTLYYYGDHTYAHLAELLEVSPATINARLTKGRALLRRRLRSLRS